MFNSLRAASRLPLRSARWNSTASPPMPPLMATMRSDLKTAMRAKDSARLEVLRALISEYNNWAKTPRPIENDVHLLALIQKRIAAGKEAGQEFIDANRPDLKDKEDARIAVLEEYAGQVKTMSLEEVKTIVSREMSKIQAKGNTPNIGLLMKALSGGLKGQVQPSVLTKVIKDSISASKS